MTTGEGGMVVLADEAAARTARLLRNQGMDRPYENEIVGYNMRMTDVAAAMGRVQLRRLAGLTARRQANAAVYDRGLGDRVTVPPVAPGAVHVYHQYTIQTKDRDQVARDLEDSGIESRVFYPTPVHRLAPYALDLDLARTEEATRRVLSLPVGPHVTPEQAQTVADAVAAAVARVADR